MKQQAGRTISDYKEIVRYAGVQSLKHRLLSIAAGVAFYTLLALFPALTIIVSLYGLFMDPAVINEHLHLLSGVIPDSTINIFDEHVARFATTSANALSLRFLLSVGLALWSANAGTKAIMDALSVVYGEREKRGFVKLTVVAFFLTIGGLLFVALAIAAIVVMPLMLAWLGFESRAAQIISMLRWPLLLVTILLWLSVLYNYGPSRTRPCWRLLSGGSIFAATTWLSGSALFSWYLTNFADYDAMYGALGAVVGLMMWLWLSVVVILAGGELNAAMHAAPTTRE